MRLLLAIVVLAALGWSGWWWFHASARERALEAWLAERRADGWVAEAAEISVTGFPNRIDAMIEGLELADPASGWSWRAPQFQILSMSWKPHHVIAVWPGAQEIASPYETVTIESGVMRGSVVLAPGPALALERTAIELEDVRVTGETGWTARIGAALLATRRSVGEDAPEHGHDVSLKATAIAPPDAWFAAIGQTGVLPEAAQSAVIDATVTFDRALDRTAVEQVNPVVEEIRIRDASMVWGELDLRGRGALAADAAGFADGEIELRARNWREMIDVAEQAGALNRTVASGLRAGLELLALLSGDRNALTAPLSFSDGETRLGPIALGEAPRLARR